MLLKKKKKILSFYAYGILSNFFTSQFIYKNPNLIVRLKRLYVNIQARKNKKIHYMYLWFLSQQWPYATHFNVWGKKKASQTQNNLLKTKPKRQRVEVDFRNRKKFFLLYQILWQIVITQINSEKKIWTFQQLNVLVKMFGIPLTPRTNKLKGPSNYFSEIPLTLQFRFTSATAFEKLFFLRALKYLSPDCKLKGLDSFRP